MSNFNDRQLEAITCPANENILVSAAAGSGKTKVLIERIIDLIVKNPDKYSFSNIAVMTFTVKATNEMKRRLKERLDIAINENPENTILIKESSLITSASISTIDSFCKKIVDENYNELREENSLYGNFDPAYRIADEKELAVLYDDVLNDLLEKHYSDEKFQSLFNAYIDRNKDDAFKEMILDGYNFLSSIPFATDYLSNKILNFEKENEEFITKYLEEQKKLIEDFKNTLDKYEKSMRDFVEIMESGKAASKSKGANYEYATNFINFINNAFVIIISDIKKSNIDDESIENIAKEITNIKWEKHADARFCKDDKEEFYNCKAIYEDFKAKCALFTGYVEIKNLDKKLIINENEKKLLEFLQEFYILCAIEKKKKNIYAISDYTALTLDILYDKKISSDGTISRKISSVAKKIADTYKLIFVDEYQDTNLAQESILRALSYDFKDKKIFMVGDIKQSIYQFRDADPSIFNAKYDLYNNDINAGKLITLSQNYRSSTKILSYINDLFCEIMTKNYGVIVYKNEGKFFISEEAKGKSINEEKVSIDIIKVSDESETEDTGVNNIEYEAEYVAKKINELLSTGKYKYNDIAILLRSTKDKASYFLDALTKYNIPAYTKLNKGFYNRFEIKLVISILNVIDNPLQNIPLASVLRSSLFGITNEELAYIRLLYKNSAFFDKNENFMLYDAVKYYIENGDNKKLCKKLDDFIRIFEEFRFKTRYLSISELINDIYETLNIKDSVLSMRDGSLRIANLMILYNNAKSYESTSYVGLFNFLRYIEKIIVREDDQGQAKLYDENDNVVNIMSIHASKGLEFKVVFLCDIEKGYNYQDTRKKYFYDKNLGVALDYVDDEKRFSYKTIKRQYVLNKKTDDIRQEEMRMLYVALTRAMERLIITGVDKNGKANEKEVAVDKADSFMDLIIGIGPQNNDNVETRYVEKTDIEKMTDIRDTIDIDTVIATNTMAKDDVEKAYLEKFDEKNIEKCLIDKYEYNDLQNISPKFSVTALKESSHIDNYVSKIYDDESIELEKKENDERVDGTIIGLAYHRYMRFYDFNKNESIEDCIEYIDIKKIENLKKSIVGEKMTKAFKNKTLYREHKFMKLFSQDDINNFLGKNEDAKYFCKNGNLSKEKQIIIQGIIDAFLIEKDEKGHEYITLIDYKTDKISSKKEIEKESLKKYLVNNYKIQLDIYAKVLEELTGLKVKEKYIYSFTIDEVIVV